MLACIQEKITFWVTFGVAISIQVITNPAAAQEIHASLCLHGCPNGSPMSNDLVIRDIYILSNNDSTKFADWVAYGVTNNTIGKSEDRNWKPDPWLSTDETLVPDDYKGAHAELNTDRGHQAPLASFTSTPDWEATNFLSNITPQKSALNQGVWVKLETRVRLLATSSPTDTVFVMTGPLYEREMPSLPGTDKSHVVPSGYWKIIATTKDGDIKIASFVFDQETERRAQICDDRFITNVRTIEERTNLDFFHALSQDEQETLETGPSTLLMDLGCDP